MSRVPPFGTAHAEVLVRMASPQGANGRWSLKDGTALYENRALTDVLCQGLTQQGYLEADLDGQCYSYRLSKAGQRKAEELRRGL